MGDIYKFFRFFFVLIRRFSWTPHVGRRIAQQAETDSMAERCSAEFKGALQERGRSS